MSNVIKFICKNTFCLDTLVIITVLIILGYSVGCSAFSAETQTESLVGTSAVERLIQDNTNDSKTILSMLAVTAIVLLGDLVLLTINITTLWVGFIKFIIDRYHIKFRKCFLACLILVVAIPLCYLMGKLSGMWFIFILSVIFAIRISNRN